MQLKHTVQGIGISVGGAFVWVFTYLQWMYDGKDEFLVVLICSLFGLVLSCVYTVPLGVALGVLLPLFCSRNSRWLSVTIGGLTGMMVGVFTSVLVAALFDLDLRSVLTSMCVVCALVLAGWTLYLWKRSQVIPPA